MIRPVFVDCAALLAPAVVFTAILSSGSGTSTDPEVQRLQRHFATVEQELLARDVSHLSPFQRAARARHIERLRTYAQAAVFPKNTDFPGRLVPYFIDRFGTRCAMAHLIEQAGQAAYVKRVAEKINNAYIADIARDSELAAPLLAWLEDNGLTVEEAARIQPTYCDGGVWLGPGPPPPCSGEGEPGPSTARSVSTGYQIGTGAVVATGLTTIALGRSLFDWGLSPRTAGWLGVTAGALGLALGIPSLDDGQDAKTWGAVNAGVGALAMIFGLDAALRSSQPQTATALSEPAAARVTAAPWVVPQGGAGVLMSLKF
jgi:hypothetical protein